MEVGISDLSSNEESDADTPPAGGPSATRGGFSTAQHTFRGMESESEEGSEDSFGQDLAELRGATLLSPDDAAGSGAAGRYAPDEEPSPFLTSPPSEERRAVPPTAAAVGGDLMRRLQQARGEVMGQAATGSVESAQDDEGNEEPHAAGSSVSAGIRGGEVASEVSGNEEGSEDDEPGGRGDEDSLGEEEEFDTDAESDGEEDEPSSDSFAAELAMRVRRSPRQRGSQSTSGAAPDAGAGAPATSIRGPEGESISPTSSEALEHGPSGLGAAPRAKPGAGATGPGRSMDACSMDGSHDDEASHDEEARSEKDEEGEARFPPASAAQGLTSARVPLQQHGSPGDGNLQHGSPGSIASGGSDESFEAEMRESMRELTRVTAPRSSPAAGSSPARRGDAGGARRPRRTQHPHVISVNGVCVCYFGRLWSRRARVSKNSHIYKRGIPIN